MHSESTKRRLLLALISLSMLLVIMALLFIGPAPKAEQYILHTADDLQTELSVEKKNEPSNTQNVDEVQILTQTLSEQLESVAISYEQQMRFPHYSTPVIDVELARTPQPFSEARIEMPVFDSNGELSDVSISSSVDKLRYLTGESITLQTQFSGIELSDSIFIYADIKDLKQGKTLIEQVTLYPIDHRKTEFRASFESEQLNLNNAQELLAVVHIEINGQNHINTVPFLLGDADGQLRDIASVKQSDEYLEIDLEYTIDTSGYYFVFAVLDDAMTDTPLVSLQAEGKMTAGSDSLTLKAHHAALKHGGSQGPYTLRIVKSYRGAKPGEGEDVPTALAKNTFSIPEFSFDGYLDIPYESPSSQARLAALRSLSKSQTSTN